MIINMNYNFREKKKTVPFEKKSSAIRTKEAKTAREIFRKLGFRLKMIRTSYLMDGDWLFDLVDLCLINSRPGGECLWADGNNVDKAMQKLLEKIKRYKSFGRCSRRLDGSNLDIRLVKWLDVSLPEARTLREFIMKMNLRGY